MDADPLISKHARITVLEQCIVCTGRGSRPCLGSVGSVPCTACDGTGHLSRDVLAHDLIAGIANAELKRILAERIAGEEP